ncbi:MAG: EVE domain-containing protein [Polyangiaceae bacterium]|jgi:predicted RNA-binding protein with PUA-like domain
MARQYWLIKSEPDKYPFENLVADGRTAWDGVRNFEARNNLRAMKAGDLCIFYHSNEGKAAVGVAKVAREAYPDPGDADFSAVDVEPVRALARAVTLAEMRDQPQLRAMTIFRKPRLSVAPLSKEEFDTVVSLSKTKSPTE